ncbi:hypothetical protein HKX48_008006 [Thoreauomyces humboldtii]|nr:hypothetical protein HKX48_008006 [Thoreauomyces humboldtii]
MSRVKLCKCGSTSHKTIRHRECPLRKQLTVGEAPQVPIDPHAKLVPQGPNLDALSPELKVRIALYLSNEEVAELGATCKVDQILERLEEKDIEEIPCIEHVGLSGALLRAFYRQEIICVAFAKHGGPSAVAWLDAEANANKSKRKEIKHRRSEVRKATLRKALEIEGLELGCDSTPCEFDCDMVLDFINKSAPDRTLEAVVQSALDHHLAMDHSVYGSIAYSYDWRDRRAVERALPPRYNWLGLVIPRSVTKSKEYKALTKASKATAVMEAAQLYRNAEAQYNQLPESDRNRPLCACGRPLLEIEPPALDGPPCPPSYLHAKPAVKTKT